MADFDDVRVDALRRRRTVKWSLYGPDVLAAWAAEMDFDVSPPIRAALIDAIDREDQLAALADLTDRCGARVVADEVHAPLVGEGHRHVAYASMSDVAAAHTVTVTSASKAWNLAGLKCAQVVATNNEDAHHWRRLPIFRVEADADAECPAGLGDSAAKIR